MTIPDSVTDIGDYAFSSCSMLTSVTIPGGVDSIGDYAFNKCGNLNHLFYDGTQEQWDSISVGSYNSNLTDVTRHYNMEGYTQSGCTVKGIYCSICDETIVPGDEHSYSYATTKNNYRSHLYQNRRYDLHLPRLR